MQPGCGRSAVQRCPALCPKGGVCHFCHLSFPLRLRACGPQMRPAAPILQWVRATLGAGVRPSSNLVSAVHEGARAVAPLGVARSCSGPHMLCRRRVHAPLSCVYVIPTQPDGCGAPATSFLPVGPCI